MMAKGIAYSLAASVLALLPPVADCAVQVSSPDTRIAVVVDTDDKGIPRYSVRYRNDLVVGESRLGLRFANHPAFDAGLRITQSERSGGNSVWRQPWGERRRVRDHFNELYVLFQGEAPTRQVGLRVRV